MNNEKNKIIYDWVSVTSKIHSPDGFIRLLGLNGDGISWEVVKGAHGYRDRLYWNAISIHFNGTEEMGIWLEMSGQGCRAFESFGNGEYESIFQEVLDNPEQMNITRLDVAYDDHEGLLDIEEICTDTNNQEYVSRFRGWQVIHSDGGSSVMLGSRSSEILIRIYDKAAERGFTDGQHWVRVELQLRRERARGFLFRLRTLACVLLVFSETIVAMLSRMGWIQTCGDGPQRRIGHGCWMELLGFNCTRSQEQSII